MDEEERENLALEAMYYAQEKALAAIKDMEPSNVRLLLFRATWVKACKEFVDEHRSRVER